MLRIKAEIKSNYHSSKDAESVAKALDVDNVELDSLAVSTKTKGKSVVSVVKSNSLATAFATIDDLIRNQILVEETVLKIVKKK